jgi:hypothetical protein
MLVRCLCFALALTACITDPVPAPSPAPQLEPPPPASRDVLAPSTLALRDEVRQAGVGATLSDLVPRTIPTGLTDGHPDLVALKTGVLFARALLGGDGSEKKDFLDQLRGVRTGLATIGGDPTRLTALDTAIERVENDAIAREDFLIELDRHIQQLSPEAGWGPGDTTGPMVQAGAWLAGVDAVARAVVRSGDGAAADRLLRREPVATWFAKYIRSEAGDARIGSARHAVAGALDELRAIFSRPEIGVAGAEEVARITGQLMELVTD